LEPNKSLVHKFSFIAAENYRSYTLNTGVLQN